MDGANKMRGWQLHRGTPLFRVELELSSLTVFFLFISQSFDYFIPSTIKFNRF